MKSKKPINRVAAGRHERLISRELFDRVQEVLRANRLWWAQGKVGRQGLEPRPPD